METAIEDVVRWVATNAGAIAIICCVAAGYSYIVHKGMTGEDWAPRQWWRGRMKKRERELHVTVTAVDGFVSFVEDRVMSGEFTRIEAQEVYRRLKKSFPIKDLFASPEALKETIQRRRASGMHEPSPLPKPRRRHMLEKA